MTGEFGDAFEAVGDGSRAEVQGAGGGRHIPGRCEVGVEGLNQVFCPASSALEWAEDRVDQFGGNVGIGCEHPQGEKVFETGDGFGQRRPVSQIKGMAGLAVAADQAARTGVGAANPDPPRSLTGFVEGAGEVDGGVASAAWEHADQQSFFGGDYDISPAEAGQHLRFDSCVDRPGVHQRAFGSRDGDVVGADQIESETSGPFA